MPAREWGEIAELELDGDTPAAAPATAGSAEPYEVWHPTVVRIRGSRRHPTPLVQSGAMAAVRHPVPGLRAPAAAQDRDRRDPVRRAARKPGPCRRGSRQAPGCPVPDRVRMGNPASLQRGRRTAGIHRDGRGRNAVRTGRLQARMDAWGRDRVREGPPGRRHYPGQLAPRPQAIAVVEPERQASRGCQARLGCLGWEEVGCDSPLEISPGPPGPGRGGDPLHDLRHAPLPFPPGQAPRAWSRS